MAEQVPGHFVSLRPWVDPLAKPVEGATPFAPFVGDQWNTGPAAHTYCSRAYPNTVRKDPSARERICTVSSGELSL